MDELHSAHRGPDFARFSALIGKPAGAESCEFAIVVADEWQRKGLARKLMGVLIETARERGLKYMNGAFLAIDERMLQFASGSGL